MYHLKKSLGKRTAIHGIIVVKDEETQRMENKHEERQPQTTGGSGSAEQVGKSRDEQKNRDFDLTEEQKADIANEINVPADQVSDLKDLGAAGGRDDYAGGSNDGMSDVSTDEPTDHL